ncbi:hypothetical protein SNOG_02963 [Parastagonospora nodorum SN15]|uniref:DUF6590 domain-containing protein n=1 Tax=Phaeosphaeria nodorum (strain SN15 / ATCC MYA-4574 / FGSC 10173) TaxID=321614 RepID=Q0UZ51_PHANO|nr:hypothetical protein SNOG_02963 [Parastagonospora nodorum SN15]EAT89694.2 hypothetical protein SNOG_02963 [Parastagonospora nodorum SN15]
MKGSGSSQNGCPSVGSRSLELNKHRQNTKDIPSHHHPGNQNVSWSPIGSFASATSSHVSAATAGASIATSPYQPQYSRNSREFPRGEGPRIDGTYIGPPSLHYEKIDGSFYVRDKDFFFEGKVFAVIMNETAGETTKILPNPLDYNTSSSLNRVKYQDNIVYTNVRRFVVVRQRREFCFACPIFTYSGRATTKHGVRAAEHGVAYSWGSDPQLVKGESGITKASIAVVMADGYNVKVKDIGYVPQSHIPTLIGNWKEEDDRESRQAAAVTAAAGEPELEVLTEEDEEEEELAVQHTGKGKMKALRKTAQSAAKYVDPHIYHAYHPKWNKDSVYKTQEDESDEDEAEDDESSDEDEAESDEDEAESDEDEAESLEKGVDPSTADLIKVYPGNNSQEATDVDDSIPMASLHAQIMRKFSFALDKKGGWARDRQDLITQLHDASTRLQHWNHSILGLVDRTLEIFDSGEKKIIDTILSTVESDRPYLAGLIASYLEDILSNLDGLEDIVTTDYWTQ